MRLVKTFGQEEVPRTYTYGAFAHVSADGETVVQQAITTTTMKHDRLPFPL
jgi:hypothetical protein